MLRKLGPDEPKKYSYRFKHMTTVGEPIEPDVWRWYHEVVGKGETATPGGRPRTAASWAARCPHCNR
jgi:acyl-coenzyme A synthetase/AMP-(fatty) acid ligase